MTGIAGVALLAVSLAMGAVASTAATAALGVRGPLERWLAGAILLAAEVVLLFEALSLVEQLRLVPFLIGQAVLAFGALLLLTRLGRPMPWAGWTAAARRVRERLPQAGALPGLARRLSAGERLLAGLAVLVGAALLLELVFALVVAPNNFDSMTYHLSRAAYWLQFNTIEQFAGATARQGTFPPNAEILAAWTMILTDGDRFTQVVQLAAMLGTAGSVYCLARMGGWAWQGALFAGLVFTLLPMVVLQGTSTQNDLVVTAFLTTGALFLYRGIGDHQTGEVAVGATAVAVAVGTKTTALFMLPGIALLALAAAGWNVRRLVGPAALVVCGVLLLGSFSYINNLTHGYLFGNVDTEVRTRTPGEAVDNLVDVTGELRDTGGYSTGWLEEVSPRIPAAVSEDYSAYGPLGLLVLALVLKFLVARRVPAERKWLAVAALSYLVLFGLVYKRNDYVGRLLLPFIGLGAPLLAAVWGRQMLSGAVAALAVLALLPALLSNPNKPIVTPAKIPWIFDRTRQEQQTIVNGDVNVALNQMRPLLAPAKRVAVAGGENTWDYPYFGTELERHVVRVDPEKVSRATFDEHDVPLIVWADIGDPPPLPGVRARKVSLVIWALTKR